MELVGDKDNIYYYDDSKGTNVASVAASVRGFPRPLVLIAGGVDKGGSYEPMLEALDGVCKGIVLIGKAAPLIRAAAAAHGVAYPVIDATDMHDAVRRATELCARRRCRRAVAGVRELRHVPELRPPRPRVPRGGRGGRREAARSYDGSADALVLLACASCSSALRAAARPIDAVPPSAPNTELIVGDVRAPPARRHDAIARSSADGTVTRRARQGHARPQANLAIGAYKLDGDQLTLTYTRARCAGRTRSASTRS